jgi:hypothetical protein
MNDTDTLIYTQYYRTDPPTQHTRAVYIYTHPLTTDTHQKKKKKKPIYL